MYEQLLGMVLVAVGVWGLVEQGWMQVREFFEKLGETTLVFIFIFLIVLGLVRPQNTGSLS